MIYGYNLNLILLLLYASLIYHIKGYIINLKKSHPKLSLVDKIKNFLRFKKNNLLIP